MPDCNRRFRYGTVSSADVGFNYAGSTTKGVAATELSYNGCAASCIR